MFVQEDDEITAVSGFTRAERRRDPSRVLALTDGVFAIIITLLVLDIHVPELSAHESAVTGGESRRGVVSRLGGARSSPDLSRGGD